MIWIGSYADGSPTAPDREVGLRLKELRDLYRTKPRDPDRRLYCGNGWRARWRAVLLRTLAAALKVKPAAR